MQSIQKVRKISATLLNPRWSAGVAAQNQESRGLVNSNMNPVLLGMMLEILDFFKRVFLFCSLNEIGKADMTGEFNNNQITAFNSTRNYLGDLTYNALMAFTIDASRLAQNHSQVS
jgi:hypothetical protein